MTTIHQPSSWLYRMFDKVLVLSDQGFPIYCGKADEAMDYFSSIGFTATYNFFNPADFLLHLANGIAPESDDAKPDEQVLDLHDDKNSTKQFLISSYKKNICPVLKADMNQDSSFSSAISSRCNEV